MKNVLCYGDSNTWGAIPVQRLEESRRYNLNERWPGIMRGDLGEEYLVIEEGLCGRTTVWDDPIEGIHKNGLTYLLPCLETHSPLDVVILFLGTNDLKKRFSVSAMDIAYGIGALIKTIKQSSNGNTPPKILVLAPPPVGRLTLFAEIFDGALEKSKQLAKHFNYIATSSNSIFFDSSEIISSSDIDGIHFEPNAHVILGKKVASIVKDITR